MHQTLGNWVAQLRLQLGICTPPPPPQTHTYTISGVPHLYFIGHKVALPEGPGLATHPFSEMQ